MSCHVMSVSAQAKVSFENETRVIHLANTLTYAELLELVKNKFPNAYPCQIKYLDRCADIEISSPIPVYMKCFLGTHLFNSSSGTPNAHF